MVSKGSLSFRYLPPAHGPASCSNLFAACSYLLRRRAEAGQSAAVKELLRPYFQGARITLQRSGKESLTCLIKAIKEQTKRSLIITAGYTCPDVAAAAVRAGAKVALLDVCLNTLEMDQSFLNRIELSDVAAVVFSNLYGMPDRLEHWLGAAQASGFVLIDDGCQSALSTDSGGRVGARRGTIGVLSFGRGKAFAGIGGGAIIEPDNGSPFSALIDDRPGEASIAAALSDFCRLSAYALLSSPYLYGIPAGIPALHLGETHYDPDFELPPLSLPRNLAAAGSLREAEAAAGTAAVAEDWFVKLRKSSNSIHPFAARGLKFDGSVVPTRYPLIVPAAAKEKLWRRLRKYGVSRSYSKPLSQFPELRPHLVSSDLPQSEEASERLITLPTHSTVRPEDRSYCAEVIKELIG